MYELARELTREVRRLEPGIRQRPGGLRDQIPRATSSIPLNIAEGCGERSLGRRLYHFRVARGSATELASALDPMVDLDVLKAEAVQSAKALIVRIVTMLVGLEYANAHRSSGEPAIPRMRKEQPEKQP